MKNIILLSLILLGISPPEIAFAGTIEELLIVPSFGGASMGGLTVGGEIKQVLKKYSVSECGYYSSEIGLLGAKPKARNLTIYAVFSRELFDNNNFSGHFGIGLGYIRGVKRGALVEEQLLGDAFERIEFQTVCLPVEFTICKHFRYFGYGAKMSVNLNYHQPFVGVLFCASLGKFDFVE
ncbi:MAG: hypothetical protein JW863_02150 [Chitinispirillaceae bacterium]|nr:hypothetical protein [Chitinispirillaceae bacterium]